MSTTISNRMVNLSTIPDAVRIKAENLGDVIGPSSQRDFYATRNSFSIQLQTNKPKKIESLNRTLTRIAGANCCVSPLSPERNDIISKILRVNE